MRLESVRYGKAACITTYYYYHILTTTTTTTTITTNMENEGKISQSLLLDEDSQSISSASTAKDSTGLPGLPDCFSDSESSPSPLGASADSVMGSTPVGELIQIPESDLELNESESQRDFIANSVMEDQSSQVSKEIDTVEQMCLDMQQTHEDQENDRKRRQRFALRVRLPVLL